jgi:hypothetical protein
LKKAKVTAVKKGGLCPTFQPSKESLPKRPVESKAEVFAIQSSFGGFEEEITSVYEPNEISGPTQVTGSVKTVLNGQTLRAQPSNVFTLSFTIGFSSDQIHSG